MLRNRRRALLLAAALQGGCAGGSGPVPVSRDVAESLAPVRPPPAALELSPFYEKYIDAGGIPVVSSHRVPDLALFKAREIIDGMLRKRPDIRRSIIAHQGRVAIIARSEVTTHIPEYADLYEQEPGEDWNVRARGLGATVERPVTSAGAENVLCSVDDVYHAGQNTLVHEFAHTIHKLGLEFVDPTFDESLQNAYSDAITHKRWAGTYAATHPNEYWAEGVLAFYDAKAEASRPDGNRVNRREELRAYDPALYQLIAAVFAEDDWRPTCPPPLSVVRARAGTGAPQMTADLVQCSPHGSVPMRLRVINRRCMPVDIYWVTQECAESLRGRIGPGQQVEHNTFDGHLFRVRDSASHLLLMEFTASTATREELVVE
jgi:hypothetical protein